MTLTADVEDRLAIVRQSLSGYRLEEEVREVEALIREVWELKQQKNAVILGHNYMVPEVYYGVSDFTGDSLALARYSAESQADIILFNGVHFMAETASILNPGRKVLIADPGAGCSLAESMSGADVRSLRAQYPGVPIMSYINCTAEVKAEVDIICTSANALKITESLPGDTVIIVPDGYLAGNIAKATRKNIIAWAGKCMVHELYTPLDIENARLLYPGLTVITHPECHEEVTKLADYSGSTSKMADFIRESKAKKVLLLTECSMADNLRSEFPETEFVSTCQTCPHMRKITLRKVRDALLQEQFEVRVSEEVRVKARRSLDAMLAVS